MKIAIASGKGGTGKTTISTNLASYIARKKKLYWQTLMWRNQIRDYLLTEG